MEVRIQIPDVLKHAGLDAALMGLQALSERDLMSLGEWPCLYESGVVYKKEPRGQERWLTPSAVMTKGEGDCEDLAAWRAAELRVTGVDPGARAVAVRSGPRSWHAVVERSDGDKDHDEFEDPSATLGMRVRGGMRAPLRFSLNKTGPRNYNARVELEGGGLYGLFECDAACPVTALGGAVYEADDGYMGQIPFLAPLLNILKRVMPAPPGARKLPPGMIMPPRGPGLPGGGSLEDGVLDLAIQLRRIAQREARRSVSPLRRRRF